MDVITTLGIFATTCALLIGYGFTWGATSWWLFEATPRTRLHGLACFALGLVWPVVLLAAGTLALDKMAWWREQAARVPRAKVVRR